jgi:N-acetylneuraminic acid mutarotase
MKKKLTAQAGLFNLRVVLCAAAVCSIVTGTLAFFHSETPINISQRNLTFVERVAYQRAIEEVYWRHRIWPKENPSLKPSLDQVMSRAEVEKKVADYLRKSQTLEDYWRESITAEQLQAEMDRMAKDTKQPEVLRELFEALGNDPFVIAECLARPILAERLVREFNNGSNGPELAGKANREPIRSLWPSGFPTIARAAADPPDAAYTLPEISAPLGCTEDTWTPTSVTNAPDARRWHTAVWTGSEMIVWGGISGSGSNVNTGGRYNPSTDSWTATSTTNAPAARNRHTAVWIGSEMIVWGGYVPGFGDSNTGGKYNPGTDTWTATNTANAPDVREVHRAVWTGSEMIVWGGYNGNGLGPLNTGGRYDPSADSWTATSTTNAPAARYGHTAVWSGSEMIVWGGANGSSTFSTGGKYDPSTDAWAATNIIGSPDSRENHVAVWTGSEMIVWGGNNYNGGGQYLNTGGTYDPDTDSWTGTSTTNAPVGRVAHTAVWTGSEMIVWGGYNGSSFENTGRRYDPRFDSWTATSIANAPTGRELHTAVWFGSEMIVWGGIGSSGYFNTGGRYCTQTSATPTPTATATATFTPTSTATATATATPTATPSVTPTATPTATARPTPTARPNITPRPRPTSPPRP